MWGRKKKEINRLERRVASLTSQLDNYSREIAILRSNLDKVGKKLRAKNDQFDQADEYLGNAAQDMLPKMREVCGFFNDMNEAWNTVEGRWPWSE